MNDALILVDIQNDFCPEGALAVPGGDEVVPVANRLARRFELVVATQDWHPRAHGSFADQHPGQSPGDTVLLGGLEQTLWPVHCVQDSPGAAFHPALEVERIDRVFQKGTDPAIDSYSGFHDNGHRRATGLADYLREREVGEVYVLGLATDYCVRYTALDALREGFVTHVVVDGCRGVELSPGDVDAALGEIEAAGADLTRSDRS